LPRDTVSAVQRTAYFAGQGTWSPDQYNSAPPPASQGATSTYDRYAQLPGTTSTGVSPPPSVIDRTQMAVTETSNALRDGVEAGIAAANQQFSNAGNQVMDATRNAGEEFSRQLQGFANDPVGQMQSATNSVRGATEQALGAAGNQPSQVTNPFATAPTSQRAATGTRSQGNVAPPPWPPTGVQSSVPVANATNQVQTVAPGMTPVRTESGWTSIGSNVAPPPLIIPRSAAPPVESAPLRMANGGPSFPASSWDTGSAASTATISRSGNLPPAENTARDLVPVQPQPGQNAQPSQQAASTVDDPWARDFWGQTTQAQPAGQTTQTAPSNTATIRNPAAEWQTGAGQATLIPTLPANQTLSGNPNNGFGTTGAQNVPPTGTTQNLPNTTSEQPPWLPLLLVSLSLMGSLSANLFLGWSYLDARQKYRSLVRKTADTFRRVTNAAA
jgi:hypothetical protein